MSDGYPVVIPTTREIKGYIEDVADALALLPNGPYDGSRAIARFLAEEGLMYCERRSATHCPLATWVALNNQHWPSVIWVAVTPHTVEVNTGVYTGLATVDLTVAEREFVRLFDSGLIVLGDLA